MSELEQLLRASVVILRQRKRIAELAGDNRLLRTQLRIANLKLERRLERMSDFPALLKPQAG